MEIELDHTYDIGPESPQPIEETVQTQQGVREPVQESGRETGQGLALESGAEPVQEDPVEEDGKKKRAPLKPVFNAERLLDKDVGLPSLRKTLLTTNFKNKTDPRRDLKKLANIYKLWSHRLMPRSNLEDTAALILRAGENINVKTYRKNLVDQDKYGGLDASEPPPEHPEQPNVSSPGLFEAGSEPTQPEPTQPQSAQAETVQAQPTQPDSTSSLKRKPKTIDDSDSDSDSDLELPVPNISNTASDIANEEQARELAQDDEWDVYRQLGF